MTDAITPIPLFCMFCDNEADYIIERSKSGLCRGCSEPYLCGMSSPDGRITDIEEFSQVELARIKEGETNERI